MSVAIREISFYSEGNTISGMIFAPENAESCPTIILCHGFAGVKELLLPNYAKAFAEAGFVALIFDYRGFGASEGARGRLIPTEQIVDIRNAITFVQTLEEVDRDNISLWGTSFGGANAVITAAQDKRVKSVAVQLTFANGERVITGGMSADERAKIDSTLQKAWERTVTKDKTISMRPDQILTDEDSKEFFQNALQQYPQLATKIPLFTIQHIIEHKPEDHVKNVTVPILIIGAEHDIACPYAESEHLYNAANEPKKLIKLDAKHYDVYEGELFIQSSSNSIEWFKKHVCVQTV